MHKTPRVSIQTADFDVAVEIAALRAGDHRVGAVCSFVGTVRDRNEAPTLPAARGSLPPEGASFAFGRPGGETLSPTLPGVDLVQSMELEHYPGMTEKSIEAMIDAAHRRFDIFGARVVHRIGVLQPPDQIVLVAVTSAHRGESFKACEFLMDYLKTQAPFWKKEQTTAGAQWVDARVSDDAALAKWGIEATNAG
jgi:molybdopterin synthase catalytic subunit